MAINSSFLHFRVMQSGYIILACILVTAVLMKSSASLPFPINSTVGVSITNCSAVASYFESYGINSAEIPLNAVNDIVLRYCDIPSSGTCCTYNMETKLAGASRIQLERTTKDYIGKLSSVLATRANKFNDFFGKLLNESKQEFHAMFKRTYGSTYEQNSYVFSDLFFELEKYYTRGKVGLSEVMDTFFNILYQKMFTVLNPQYAFDDKYLGCVSEHMKELKPFGDVPDKLSVQVKRSFVATRTYAQALKTAADTAKNMINIRPNADCTTALTKMQQCNACKGNTDKPCVNFCVNVIKGCLQHFTELDSEWDNFVLLMDKVSERLLGPFNIVMVVEPINIKISEAIMNFQDTGQDISTQVFQGCGRPSLGKRKRSVEENENHRNIFRGDTNEDIELFDAVNDEGDKLKYEQNKSLAKPLDEQQDESIKISTGKEKNAKNKKKNKKKNFSKKLDNDEEEEKEPVLDKLVKDIRQKVKDSKKFWSNLPYQICNGEDIAVSKSDAQCWNGHTVDKYVHPISNDPLLNPEFSTASGTSKQAAQVSNQLYYLRTTINHLRNAYNGLDVEWADQDESYIGSGSGSGGGIDEENDHGSGLGSFDEVQPNNSDNENKLNKNNASGSSISDRNSTISGYIPNTNRDGSISKENGATRIGHMSLRRALISYLFPIYMAWFGGIIWDLL